MSKPAPTGRDSIAQGTNLSVGALALGKHRQRHESPIGARFQDAQIVFDTRESRPFRANPMCCNCYPGLTRPGLSNLAPLGLEGDFVADTLSEQKQTPSASPVFP